MSMITQEQKKKGVGEEVEDRLLEIWVRLQKYQRGKIYDVCSGTLSWRLAVSPSDALRGETELTEG